MLAVTFSQPILIEATDLGALLALAKAPATVEPVNSNATPAVPAAPVKGGRKPKNPVAVAASGKPKRTRATKAEMEARRAAEKAASDGEAPAQTTEAEPADEPTPSPEAAPTEADKVGHVKPEKAPKPAKEKPVKAAKEKPEKVDAPSPNTEGLADRFAKLIDADFTAAKALLDGFGANRLGELKPENVDAFSAKLTELGF